MRVRSGIYEIEQTGEYKVTVWRGKIGDSDYDKKEFHVLKKKLTYSELEKILRFYTENGRI